MLCGVHNHDLAPNLSGHLLAGRLRGEEKQRVIDMTKSLAKHRNILTDLKEKNKESVTLI
ncbi:otubain [Medicago truncatula]|uniref:Otubain n=1 Tax=Medicago truncatula TaxID=3880 RepID=G7IKY5_MEDTR|nr:otubain [Medicago truncatula]